MIKVSCVVPSVYKDDKTSSAVPLDIHMTSVERTDDFVSYGKAVLVNIGGATAVVNGNDLISAIENCMSDGCNNRYYAFRGRARRDDE